MNPAITRFQGVMGMLLLALVWGSMWYPLRALANTGASPSVITFMVYLTVSCLGVMAFGKTLYREFHFQPLLIPLLILFGWTNFSYSWAITEGQVMRVLLLFYLSPLWTAIFARLILKERLNQRGYYVICMSLSGCIITLYQSGTTAWFTQPYEWLAVSGGITYSLSSVLTKRNKSIPIALRSATIWFGVLIVSAINITYTHKFGEISFLFSPFHLCILLAVSISLLCTSVLGQHSVSVLPVNQIMSIMLLELVFASISSYYLAGETLETREWIGGILIISASLLSNKMVKEKT